MKYRELGRSGLIVSTVGFGAWQLGNALWGAAEVDAQALVDAALEQGCTFFDTAPGYAEGASEAALGVALASVRDRVVLCSKFGHTADGRSDFSPSAVRPALEASLRRLHTDYLDVYLLHNPPDSLIDGREPGVFEQLEQLKAEGRVRAYGVSLDWSRDLDLVLANSRSTVVEVLYNVFHQEPAAAFAHATDAGVGLIAKVPLDSGWLSGKYDARSRFEGIRDRWTPDVIARRAALVDEVRALLPPGLAMGRAALAFILANPSLSTVIPGAKRLDQLADNLAASELALPASTVAALRQMWERSIRDNPLPW